MIHKKVTIVNTHAARAGGPSANKRDENGKGRANCVLFLPVARACVSRSHFEKPRGFLSNRPGDCFGDGRPSQMINSRSRRRPPRPLG